MTSTATPETIETIAADTTLGSTTVAAIEAAWAAIVARHPEVPADVVIITGVGRVNGGIVRGHYRPSTWVHGSGRKHEVFLSGERLSDGGRGVMTTLVHEAVHALAEVRGIKETSRQNRYHNGRFAELARELGLTAPVAPDTLLGYSDCTMPDATAEVYAEVIDRLDEQVEVGIPTISIEDLYAAAVVVGFFMGGLMCLVPWWSQGQPEAMWGAMGGKVRKPRKPRQARQVELSCGCRTITVPVELADPLASFACTDCGGALSPV